MLIGKQIEDLIAAGWHLIDTDPDSPALQDWKRDASNAFKTLLGQAHTYSAFGDDLLRRDATTNVAANEGPSVAGKERVRRDRP